MSTEENKAVVRRYQEAYDQNQLDQLDDILAADFVSHAHSYPGLPPGVAGAKAAHQVTLSLFPDFRLDSEDLIAEGDKVVMRFRCGGAHTGAPMFGAPPSGKRFDITGVSIFRVSGGKIVEHWASEDELGLMQQIGLMPAA